MKKILLSLTFIILSFFSVKSQNLGIIFENNVLKIEYVKYEDGKHFFNVKNKLNCVVQIKLEKPTNQFSDHSLVSNGNLSIEIIGSPTVITTIKAKRTSGADCISIPDNGWVEMSSPLVLPIAFQSRYGYCFNTDNTIDFSFGVEQTSDIKIYNIKYSSDGKIFKTIQTVTPNKLVGPQTYKVKLK